LITVGGTNYKTYQNLSEVEILKMKKKKNDDNNSNNNDDRIQWAFLPSMNKKREHCSSVVIQHKLFACGGQNNENKHLTSIEMYDLENDNINEENNRCKWNHLSDMKYGVYASGIKSFQSKNQIILIGGQDNEKNNKLFVTYDISKNQSIQNQNTSYIHSWKPGIVIENHDVIYVIGDRGYKYDGWGAVEYYDIRQNKWFFVDHLNNLLQMDTQNRLFQCLLHA